jgi:peptide/nickel transport system substrate-binding protein
VGGGGTLSFAVPRLPATLDPLAAEDRTALTITRQVHEPLVARLSGPYGATEAMPGLALSVKASESRTVWTLGLRSGVRFQDGTPLNAAAVLANSRRWSTSDAGRALLPNLFAVDAPRPDEVRFLFEGPAPDLPRRLRSPRLGIVSPQALEPQSGEAAEFRTGAARSGTGPFQVSATSPGPVRLSRHAEWWGSGVGLGPALDGAAFTAAVSSAERLDLLRAGSVQVADPLAPPELAAISSDPLLVPVGGPGGGIGLDGSVRGIDSPRRVPVLSRVWLTTLEP